MRPRTPGAIVSREERNLSPLVSPWEGDDSLLAMSSVPGTRPDGSPYLTRDLAAILQSAGFYAHLEKLQPREDEVVSLRDSPQGPSPTGVHSLVHSSPTRNRADLCNQENVVEMPVGFL